MLGTGRGQAPAGCRKIIAPEMPSDSQTHMLPFTAQPPAFLYITVTKGLQLGPVYDVYTLNYIYPVLSIIPQLSEVRAKWKSIADSIPGRL